MKNRKETKRKPLGDFLSVWDSPIATTHKEFINPLFFPLSDISRSKLNKEKCFPCKQCL